MHTNHKVLVAFNSKTVIATFAFKTIEGLVRQLKSCYAEELEKEVEDFENDPLREHFHYHTLLKNVKEYSYETISDQLILSPPESQEEDELPTFIVKNIYGWTYKN